MRKPMPNRQRPSRPQGRPQGRPLKQARKPRKKADVPYDRIMREKSKLREVKRRDRRTAGIAYGIFVCFAVFVAGYMVWSAIGFFSPAISTEIIQLGSMENLRSVTGVIIRDETVFHAERAGRVDFSLPENERVRSGTHVASIRDVEATNDARQEVADMELVIMTLQDRRHFTIISPHIDRMNEDIHRRVNSSLHYFTSGNMAGMANLLESIETLTSNRNQLIVTENRDVRSEWGRSLDASENLLRLNSSDIYATKTGIMSPIIDNMETIFTRETMRDLTREQLRFTNEATIVPNRDVEVGDPLFKIVGNIWYIAAHFPNDMVQGWDTEQYHTVFVQNAITGTYQPLVMRVYHFDRGTMESYVVLRSTRYVIDFINQRNINIRTADNVSRGFKINTSSVATRNFYRIPTSHIHNFEGIGDAFVQLSTDYGLQNIVIEITRVEGNVALVLQENSGIALGSRIAPVDILGQYYTLSQTSSEHGIYRANMGYAYFTAITLDGEISETDSHIILDPALNSSLSQHNVIVSDASSVEHRQIIR